AREDPLAPLKPPGAVPTIVTWPPWRGQAACRASVHISQVPMCQELATRGRTHTESQVLDWKRLTKGMRWPCRMASAVNVNAVFTLLGVTVRTRTGGGIVCTILSTLLVKYQDA